MIISPIIIFIAFLIVAFLFVYAGKLIGSKEPIDKEAETSYAGGENIPGEMRFPGYERFFTLALFFTVLHVLALLIGLMVPGAAMFGLIYTGIICFALLAIFLR